MMADPVHHFPHAGIGTKTVTGGFKEKSAHVVVPEPMRPAPTLAGGVSYTLEGRKVRLIVDPDASGVLVEAALKVAVGLNRHELGSLVATLPYLCKSPDQRPVTGSNVSPARLLRPMLRASATRSPASSCNPAMSRCPSSGKAFTRPCGSEYARLPVSIRGASELHQARTASRPGERRASDGIRMARGARERATSSFPSAAE